MELCLSWTNPLILAKLHCLFAMGYQAMDIQSCNTQQWLSWMSSYFFMMSSNGNIFLVVIWDAIAPIMTSL